MTIKVKENDFDVQVHAKVKGVLAETAVWVQYASSAKTIEMSVRTLKTLLHDLEKKRLKRVDSSFIKM